MLDDFFSGKELSRRIFVALESAMKRPRRDRGAGYHASGRLPPKEDLCMGLIPGIYLVGEQTPLVLALSLRRKDSSKRWKQIVEPAGDCFKHHLQLWMTQDMDSEVRAWLLQAWSQAG